MIFTETKISGCFLVELDPRTDERGFFARFYCENEFRAHGLDPCIAQINTGFTRTAGSLRGLHYQTAPHEDTKLVKCLAGSVHDVCLDLRPESPTFRDWFAVELSAANRKMLFLPAGTAHGYQTLSDDAEIMYITNQEYAPQCASGVRYDDKSFNIQWPREVTSISHADKTWPDFRPDIVTTTRPVS